MTNCGRLPTTVRTRTARACHVARLRSPPCACSSPAEPATSARSSPASCSTAATTSPCSTRSTAAIARRSLRARRSSRSTCSTPTRRAASCSRASTACCTSPRSRWSRESVARPERYYHGNVVASLHLLDAMREAGVKRLVFSSTCATYGEPDHVPISEDDARRRPSTPYGNSKLAVDRMIADEARAHGLGAVSLRYFNVAGASGPLGEDHEPETHLIPLVLRAAAGRTAARVDPRHRLPDRGRHRDPRLRPRRRPRPRAPARARQRRARTPRDLQPRLRHGLLGAPGDRGRARGHRPRDPGARGARAGPATRRGSSPPTPRPASGSAGSPSARSRTWSATPGTWHQAHPDGYRLR